MAPGGGAAADTAAAASALAAVTIGGARGAGSGRGSVMCMEEAHMKHSDSFMVEGDREISTSGDLFARCETISPQDQIIISHVS
jgi:hypothetical protein